MEWLAQSTSSRTSAMPLTQTKRKRPTGSVAVARLLTEDEFNSIGFTKDELTKYKTPGSRINAPKEFAEKMQRAHFLFSEKWQVLHGLKKPEPKPQAPAPAEPAKEAK
jgi:hypothetical protein